MTLKEFIEFCETRGCTLVDDRFFVEISSPSGKKRTARFLMNRDESTYVPLPAIDDDEELYDETVRNLLRRLNLQQDD